MPFTDLMFPSRRFQWLELANSGTKVEGEREAVGVSTFFADLPDGTNMRS